MKSACLHGIGDLQIHEEPIPVAGMGEKLIRIRPVGVCGSDMHWFAEGSIGDAKLNHPLVMGHEFEEVTEDGQRVAIDPAISCGHCEYCEQGHPNLCDNIVFAGHGKQDGALRAYGSYPTRCLLPIPDSLSYADGAMLESLGVAIHTVDLGKVKAGMTVGMFGSGPIGSLIIQMAKLSGAANISATDKLPHRVDAAKRSGADQAYLGVDVSFEVAGTQDAVDVRSIVTHRFLLEQAGKCSVWRSGVEV
ncbi:MAG: alcohol dehydrogenase catalytic domain-containing protein [Anaerolineales bacterium]|nr:alcohol dehydrogenase catalytic domain-containing protein [Anaerolineales bacterium]